MITKDASGEGSQDELLSLEDMKRVLQNAERRLCAHEPIDAQISPDVRSHGLPASTLPKLQKPLQTEPYLTTSSGIARIDPARVANDNERRLANQAPPTANSLRARKLEHKQTDSNAGPNWFNLPRTKLTSELKRDLQLLKMRSTLDPKRHYKTDNRKPLTPDYSQIGTFLQTPTERLDSRILKRDRKKSFVEEMMAVDEGSGRLRSKYASIQVSKSSGRRAHYNKVKQRRSRGFLKP